MKLENLVDYGTLETLIVNAYQKRSLKQRPLLIVGHQGVGKTKLVQAVAKKLGIDYYPIDACAKEPADFSGVPKEHNGRTIFVRPELLPSEGAGILHIDEINRAHPDVIQVLYTLFSNRGIGKHTLGDDWIIVCSCNPSESEDDTTYNVNEIDVALEGRFRKFGVASDPKGWLNWFEGVYSVDSLVYQYALSDTSVVRFDGHRGTPRDFEELEKSVQSFGTEKPKLLHTVATSCVGPEIAADFAAFLNLRSYCTADMILGGDWRECASGLEKAKHEGRFDIEIVLLRTVNELYLKRSNPSMENLIKFLEHVGAEKAFTFFALLQGKFDASGKDGSHKGRDTTIQTKLSKLVKAAQDAKSKVFKWAKDHEEAMARFQKGEKGEE